MKTGLDSEKPESDLYLSRLARKVIQESTADGHAVKIAYKTLVLSEKACYQGCRVPLRPVIG